MGCTTVGTCGFARLAGVPDAKLACEVLAWAGVPTGASTAAVAAAADAPESSPGISEHEAVHVAPAVEVEEAAAEDEATSLMALLSAPSVLVAAAAAGFT